MKREQWPGLGRILACLSCWPQCFHAVINPTDNAELRALFLRTHSTLRHILMAWHRPPPQSPLCLKQSTLPGWGPQLVRILVGGGFCQFAYYYWYLKRCLQPRFLEFLKVLRNQGNVFELWAAGIVMYCTCTYSGEELKANKLWPSVGDQHNVDVHQNKQRSIVFSK